MKFSWFTKCMCMESKIKVVPLYTEFDQLEFVHLITFPKNYWANKSFYLKFQLLVITELCYWVGLYQVIIVNACFIKSIY